MADPDLSLLIAACYAAATEPDRWPSLLDQLGEAVGARGATITFHDPKRTAHPVIASRLNEIADDYSTIWWRHDTRIARCREIRPPPGSVLVDEDYFPDEMKRPDPFSQEFFRKHGFDNLAAYVDIDPTDGSPLTISALRDTRRGSFEAVELERYRILAPHAARAFKLRAILDESRRHASGMALALEHVRAGVVLLDRQGCLVQVTERGERLLAGYMQLGIGRVPAATLATERAKLKGTIAALLREDALDPAPAILLRGAGGRPPLFIEAFHLPVDGAAHAAFGQAETRLLLLVRDPFAEASRSIVPLLEQLGLTPAEARVAMRVGRGHPPRQVAAEAAVEESTVRAQLRSIFAKLGIRRQSELAVLITRFDSL